MQKAAYLPGLNGIRALAVSAIVFSHFGQNWSWTEYPFWRLVAHNCVFGVDSFFILSGFLITYLLVLEEDKRGKISLKNFYQRRALRILPPALLYLATLAALAGLGFLTIEKNDFLHCLFFVRNFFSGAWQTDHFWSLAIEEQFYLFWPALFFLVGKKWRLSVAIALLVASILWYHFYHSLIPGNPGIWRTDLRIEPLWWGCSLALLLHSTQREKLLPWITRVGATIAGVFLIASLCFAFSKVPVFRSFVGHAMLLAVTYLLAFLVIHPRSRLATVFELSPIKSLGLISYSVYLWQQLFLPLRETPLDWANRFPFSLILPILVATLSYQLMEVPLRKYRRV